MRTILDANVLISALLGWSAQRGAEVAVVRAAIEGRFPLVLPPELIRETRSTLATRIHLRKVVTPADADAFLGLLIEAGFIPRELATPPPAICRDPRDDYLLAHAAAEEVDFLVTGDKDLTSLDDSAFDFAIVRPRDFLALLASGGLPQE